MNKAINSLIKAMNNRSENQKIMEMSSFDVQNNEIWILLYQSEAGKIKQAIKPIFKYYYYICCPKIAISITIFVPMIFL